MSAAPADIEALEAQMAGAGDRVRNLKQSGAPKAEVDAAVAELLRLKTELAAAKGEPAPAAGKKEKAKQAKAAADAAKAEKAKQWEPKDKSKLKKKLQTLSQQEAFVNPTPPGDKKDMTTPMADAYHPQAVEAAWNDWWEASGFFKPNDEAAATAGDKDKFVIVIPPPNVTGSLHLGHALTSSIEDTLCRWHRMSGRHVLWVPGTDHAGIATQVVVEKKIMKEEGMTRHDLGRERFVERVITTQQRRLGASVDWGREVFTMDEPRSRAVTEAFVRMFEDGLIYREERLVNWCCALRTAISDIEVEYVDIDAPTRMSVPGHKGKYEFGTLTEFAYRVEGSDKEIVVATTRLETMLGDTAVAVHPEDPRYAALHGKFLLHPFDGRRLPIICDAMVDKEFGTGAVKITPAHDPNDFACGNRHNLERINIFSEDGTINANGGRFAGMMRFDARVAVEQALDEMGLLRGKTPNKMRLGLCSRTSDVVEPLLKPQWWVRCGTMAERAAQAVRDGELQLLPDFHNGTWFHWLENIRDWCISRQLWWGHRIPAYFVTLPGESAEAAAASAQDRWVVGRTEDEARQRAAERFGCAAEALSLAQDPDVLDTWFSSALFPFSVHGWPDATPDMATYYPTTLLETGHDILFFWVARMVMMGLQLTGQLPFRTVYLHAMVRDKYGRKMSKSRGNVIDPLEVIEGATLEQLHRKLEMGNLDPREVETAKQGQKMDYPEGIPECGTDALRFGLLAYTLQGRDVNLDILRVVGYRQFCNKLWNATRFAMMHLGGFEPTDGMEEAVLATASDRERWILARLQRTVCECDAAFKNYAFADLTTAIYNFWLYSLCDVYLEAIKPVMREEATEAKLCAQRVLYLCLDYGLRLLHPCMPFVTEELWQRLPGRGRPGDAPSIMLAKYPQPVPAWADDVIEASMAVMQDVLRAARAVRSEYNVKPSQKLELAVMCNSPDMMQVLTTHKDTFEILANASAGLLRGYEGAPAPEACAVHVVNDSASLYTRLADLIKPEVELEKLGKKREEVQRQLEAQQKKMTIPDYESKVPERVRTRNTERLEALQKEAEALEAAIANMEAMQASLGAAEGK